MAKEDLISLVSLPASDPNRLNFVDRLMMLRLKKGQKY